MLNPWRDVPAEILRNGFAPMHRPAGRSFQGIPSIACTAQGRIWAAWLSGGTKEPHIDNYAVLAYSDDGGKTWVDPALVIDHPDSKRVRINFITLWADESNKLWMCWGQAAGDWNLKENAYISSFCVCMENPDADHPIIGRPFFMFPAWTHSKPIRTSNGEWLFTTDHVFNPHAASIYAAKRLGETPVLRGTAHSRCPWKFCHAATLIERRDGSLWQLSRIEQGHYGGIEESVSRDGGRIWSDFEMQLPDPLTGPGSRFHLSRLQSGAMLLLNHVSHHNSSPQAAFRRTSLAAFLSDDDGKTWTKPYIFDERIDISYPDACQMKDGRILIIYDHNRKTDAEILFLSLTEEEIRQGQPTSQIVSRRR